MMYIGQSIGIDDFTKFQRQFGFGLKTNIDLAGEARTEGLTYKSTDMVPTDLAVNTFGQGFNVDMIEMITGYCSLINGGYLYEPHVVKKIVNSSGATVKNIEPRVLRQTISQSTSDKIRQYCEAVVMGDEGTGRTARPAGYRIIGKTGTAQTLPRKNRQYVVSFMGAAPANDPKIAIYVVVDRPNIAQQDQARLATVLVRKILTEALPYLNIPMTEELSEKELQELEALREKLVTPILPETTEENAEEGASTDASTEGASSDGTVSQEELEAAQNSENAGRSSIWQSFDVDPETGYYIDPETGDLLDPTNGSPAGADDLPDFEHDLPQGNSEGNSGE
jgi:stage V sporulation protein D (sporulation-specific penicillin-binding protein)